VPEIVVGPMLRYVGECDATVWVETDQPCEVEVLDHRARTFMVEGHHYALVVVEGLAPGSTTEYDVRLDGTRCWPHPDSEWPGSTIRTLKRGAPVELAFGSCRVAVPHRPPFCLDKDDDERGRGVDALLALALSLRELGPDERPHALLLLGDQIYADEVSPLTERFIAERRDVHQDPGPQVCDYEEYTRLYWESWRDPAVRWLFSSVSTAMIFDDHDVHDDWNTSQSWIDEIRTTSWWQGRIEAALMSYWVYQHLGNLSPRELATDHLYSQVRDAGDAGPILREFARCADDTPEGARWSYHRDLGSTRLLVVDSRAGRVLTPGNRDMLDEDEWTWIEEHSHGDFDHLLIATSLPTSCPRGCTTSRRGTRRSAREPGASVRPARANGSARRWTSSTGRPSTRPSRASPA
jgi:hypothetical protein